MCRREITHHMACEAGRPLITDRAGETHFHLIVDPYGQPPPCGDDCPGDQEAAGLKTAEVCSYHGCCRVEFADFFCPCCPTPRDSKDVSVCDHFEVYRKYVQNLQQSEWSKLCGNPAVRDWPSAEIPDKDMCNGNGEAPVETELFCMARKNVYAMGAELFNAKKEITERRLDYDRACEDSSTPTELIELHRVRYLEAKWNAGKWMSAFDATLDLYFYLEHAGQGTIDAPFAEKARQRLHRPPKRQVMTREEAQSMQEFKDFVATHSAAPR